MGLPPSINIEHNDPGVWALLLSHYSGEQDIVFGVTVSGRPASLPGAESMMGLFINTLPLRVRAAAQAPLVRWLKELQDRQAELDQYQYTPLYEIQRWLGFSAERPLFDNILVFENYPRPVASLEGCGGLEFAEARFFDQTNYPLSLTFVPGENATSGQYDEQRFERTPFGVGSTFSHLGAGHDAKCARTSVDLPWIPTRNGTNCWSSGIGRNAMPATCVFRPC
jgi:hypothetical protein